MMTGMDWTVEFPKGAICRYVMWNGKEVACVNSRGDFDDRTEADLAAGIAHSAKMHFFMKRLSAAGSLTSDLAKELRDILTSVETIDTGSYAEAD